MFNLEGIQSALADLGVDGWLLFDFHGSNALARRTLKISANVHTTRRFYYYIPTHGQPVKLNHRIELDVLAHLPGEPRVYLRWKELEDELRSLLGGAKKIAMEYSPRNAIPYVSVVDAGTVEMIRGFGVEVVSSGDLITEFEATLTPEQWKLHLEAERHMLTACSNAWKYIAGQIAAGTPPRETEVQTFIVDYFAANNVVTDHAPIVGTGPNSGNPHYSPSPLADAAIERDSFILIDLWGKMNKPGAIVADYTRVGYAGSEVPGKFIEIFNIVKDARDAAVELVKNRFLSNEPVFGWEVDDASRAVIEEAGYGKYFIHRTGHNIAEDTHGNGTHMDNLETHDDRRILRRTCFSVEPGIYLEEFGVRSEIDVYVDGEGHVHVTGDPQQEIIKLF